MNKERIKILHVSKATGIAGSENHLLSLLPRLDRSKYEVTFMILIEQDKPLDDYFHMFEQKGIKTKRLIIRRDVDPKCLWEMYLFIRRNRFDIVHTHLVHADLYGTLAAKLAGVKCIVSTKHNDNNFRYNWFFKVVNKQLSNLNNRVITISQWLEKFSKEIEKIKKGFVYRGVTFTDKDKLLEYLNAERGAINFTKPTEEDLKTYGTAGLTFYRQEFDSKGKPLPTKAMKVKIALQGDFEKLLKMRHPDGDRVRTLERLNQLIKDEKWLNTDNNRRMISMIGGRPPIQGLNSLEFME